MRKSKFDRQAFVNFDKAMDYLMFELNEKGIDSEDWEIILFCCHGKDTTDLFCFAALDFNSESIISEIDIATISRESSSQNDLDRIGEMRRFKACKHNDCGIDMFTELGDENPEIDTKNEDDSGQTRN